MTTLFFLSQNEIEAMSEEDMRRALASEGFATAEQVARLEQLGYKGNCVALSQDMAAQMIYLAELKRAAEVPA